MSVRINFTMTVDTDEGYKANIAESLEIEQVGLGAQGGIVSVGTSEENLSVGDVGTEGLLFLKNLDSTNYVEFGMSDSGTMKPIGKLLAGEIAFFRMKPGQTLRWQANTAAVKVNVLLLTA